MRKAQRQDSIAHLDNWKKLLVTNSYTFFKFPFKPIPSPSGAVPSYRRETFILPVLKALQCLFLGDSLHYVVIYLDCNILCVFVLLKILSSLKAGTYV